MTRSHSCPGCTFDEYIRKYHNHPAAAAAPSSAPLPLDVDTDLGELNDYVGSMHCYIYGAYASEGWNLGGLLCSA